MEVGNIVLVPFPFTDLSGNKLRPALILAKDETDLIVAFITSQNKWVSDNTIYVKAALANGLKVDSLVRLNKIATLSLDICVGKLGSLESYEMDDVKNGLKKLFEIS
jgi:mRNA interferase MazF